MVQFDDIRPYNDEEIPTVLNELANDPQFAAVAE
jgi:hypothetical protein